MYKFNLDLSLFTIGLGLHVGTESTHSPIQEVGTVDRRLDALSLVLKLNLPIL